MAGQSWNEAREAHSDRTRRQAAHDLMLSLGYEWCGSLGRYVRIDESVKVDLEED